MGGDLSLRGLLDGHLGTWRAQECMPFGARSRTSWAPTYSNNLEKIETIRDDGLIEGADPTIAALTGRIDVRFAETTLIDLAAGGTPVDLEFAYTLSAQAKLVLTAHEVYLPKPKLAVEGPGGVQASFRLPGREEHGRRAHAHGDPDQRPRRVGLWLTDSAGSCLWPDNLGVI